LEENAAPLRYRFVTPAHPMITLPRPAVVLFLACALGGLLPAQERAVKWSPWRQVDEKFPNVRIRTNYDDNEGRGWQDGRHHWRYEVKNTSARLAMKVGLAFSQWNLRTRVWDPPAEGMPPPFELDPGEVHEGATVGAERDGFAYRYALGVIGEDGQAKRIVTGLAHSRIVISPIKESSLVANAAHARMQEPERVIAANADQATAAPAPAPVAPSAKPTPPETKTAAPVGPPANLPMNAPALAPVSTEGLDAAAKFSLWTQRAQQGDAESMFQLGRACRFGDGTARDHVAATEWYRQAALRGHAAAMTRLGYAYDSGLGVERSESASIEWWRKAAALGEPDATQKLAKLGLAP
jgi:hypothetical protein